MPKYKKHEHIYRIISHTIDWQKALLMCASCIDSPVWTAKTNRVKIGDRKYRDQSEEEFLATLSKLEHLCCA